MKKDKPAISEAILQIFSNENLEKNSQIFENLEFISEKEFIIKFPIESHIFLPNSKDQPLSSNTMWKNDKISPSNDIMNYDQPIYLLYSDYFFIWPLETSELLMYCVHDESFIYSTNKHLYFHHIFSENITEKVYCTDNLPISSKNERNIVYQIYNIINFGLNSIRFNDCFKIKRLKVEIDEKANTKSFLEHYKENNEHGTFIAYGDSMVKCCFNDRTLITIDRTQNFVMILTKTGENLMQKINEQNEFSR